MAAPKKRGSNEPEPRPIIVKKIIVEGHGGHHGGAWKVAYADFVTAMMAFFLLMWLLGATTERQRKSLADYFTPTLVEMKLQSAGSNGLFGGDSLVAKDNYPTTGGKGNRSITIPRDATGVNDEGGKSM
ncbi:MAG: flagellar motor protein MotB, partial [Alphaproteobacteria bacterium]|nr:flagellar motor protein MotB [Alphaproteobacteria bacterium]